MEHTISLEAGHDCIKFECQYGSSKCIPGEGGYQENIRCPDF